MGNIKDEIADPSTLADIAIVGGGFAGCLAAILLDRVGHKVTLIDLNSANSALFRAEKVSGTGDQLSLLQELALLDDFKKASTLVKKYTNIRGSNVIGTPDIEEYGILYPAMVELLRKKLPSSILFKVGKVVDVQCSASVQRIILADGEMVHARLAVIATGSAKSVRRRLGFESSQMHPIHTVCAGFTLKPPASGVCFDGLAAYGERCGDGVDYMAIFPLGSLLRANLFMFTDIRDPRISALRTQGLPAVYDILPGLRPWLQGYELTGDVAVFSVELAQCDNVTRDGIVLIGDAFRTSCPAAGTGLSCSMVDVMRLCYHATQWLKTPGMEAAKIAAFYADPVKIARDGSAFREALQRRKNIVQSSLLHWLYLMGYYHMRSVRDWLRSAVRSPKLLLVPVRLKRDTASDSVQNARRIIP